MYKSVLFPSLQVVADKVVVVASHEKSSQIIQELNSLRTLLDESEGEREHPRSKNIVRLLEVYPNPRYVCLRYFTMLKSKALSNIALNTFFCLLEMAQYHSV